MAIRKKISKKKKSSKVSIEGTQPSDKIKQYTHNYTKRTNNPPVGLVTPETDEDMPTKQYSYDPHLDPQLIWTDKTEHTSFDVDTVSLHVHERIDPFTIINTILKEPKTDFVQKTLFGFFNSPENNPPLREAIEFYKHDQRWSNRLIAGDSLLVMNSLLQKEGLGEHVQMIYIDPPYGIEYKSNFQPFINQRNVINRKDEDLTQEPETIKAFRDTWELGIHSYLTYLRDRLLLSRDLLNDTGSIFVQISDKNLHHVKELLDEVFGSNNFCAIITFVKTNSTMAKLIPTINDFVIWYAKNKKNVKFNPLFVDKTPGGPGAKQYTKIISPDGTETRSMTPDELTNPKLIPKLWKIFRLGPLTSQGSQKERQYIYNFNGEKYTPPKNRMWTVLKEEMDILVKLNRIAKSGNSLASVMYLDDYPITELSNIWTDTGTGSFTDEQLFVVQTSSKVIQRCMLMTTSPGDLVFDPTCGSGTTAFVSEMWGRRWITCDTSRIAITLAKQRIMTGIYDFYKLNHPNEGIKSDFEYKKIFHVTMTSIAKNEPPKEHNLYDQPTIINNITRITGPFTIEAVPSPTVKSLDSKQPISEIDQLLSHSGESFRQEQWRDELLKSGVRGKDGQRIEFSRVESHPATNWIHADAETKEKEPKRVIISFGPEHAPLEQRQVARTIEEAQTLVPKPKIIIFTAFQFDPEASKDIDELNWPGVTILKAHMNADLLTNDLKKKHVNNELFWLMGQPDVELKKLKDGKFIVEVNGFDYYNTKTGEIESGDSSKIAMWMLDTDYDGRSLYPQQIFFPLLDSSSGWNKLIKTLKEEINEELLEHYQGTISLPFVLGANKQIAVKIIDDRGIESLRILKEK